MEGVKIRSRIEEQLKGETVSTFLIKKQSQIKKKQFIQEIKSEGNVLDNLDEGVILNTKDNIEMYIRKYYQKLYSNDPIDDIQQQSFLRLINNKLNEDDKNMLSNDISEQEIYKAINDLNINNSPGIDGIPVEFFQTFLGHNKSRTDTNNYQCNCR